MVVNASCIKNFCSRQRLSSSDSFKNQDGLYAHVYDIDGPGVESLEICKTFQT